MKILYISFSFIPSRTANSLHVMKMCQALGRNGHEVFLIAPDNRKEYEKDVTQIYYFYNVESNFKIIRLPYPNIKGKTYLYWSTLIIYLLKINPDIVYGRYISGTYIASLLRYRCIFEAHDKIWLRSKRDLKHFKGLINSKKLIRVVTISNVLKEYYIRKFENKKHLLYVQHDSSDIADHSKKLTFWKGNTNKLQIGYVGHLYKGKGVEIVIKIASDLKEFDFHIIGGYPSDIEYWMNQDPPENLMFHGFVPQNKISYYINHLHICLLPNQKVVMTYGSKNSDIGEYTSPLKLFDYMSHKKVIIASNIPVLKEVLEHNKNAWLCDPENETQWIEALLFLSKNPDIRERLRLQAFQDFKNKYTWEIRAKNVLTL